MRRVEDVLDVAAHRPWPLPRAEAELSMNTMTAQIDVRLPEIPPLP